MTPEDVIAKLTVVLGLLREQKAILTELQEGFGGCLEIAPLVALNEGADGRLSLLCTKLELLELTQPPQGD